MLNTIENPPNPWTGQHIDWIGEPPTAKLKVYRETARQIISTNNSPDLSFRHSVNPYRGCYHACAYCYARPMHQYWDFGAGTDWDTKIVVKTNAAEALRRDFDKKSWRGEPLLMSGSTDPYQPLEASFGLTRACLEVCAEYRNPVWIITKSALVRRDIDILQTLNREATTFVHFSIPFSDDDVSRRMEPFVPKPKIRFAAMRALHDAGIPVGISISPLIPSINDSDIVTLLERAREAGATWAFCVLLRLPREVLPVFSERLASAFPLKYDHVMSALESARGGSIGESGFGKRMVGVDERWKMIQRLFRQTCKRLGFNEGERPARGVRDTFKRPGAEQLDLF
ncbi:MAG: PA0069 family radical SAM protein [Myxococcales bacterium]|nr:PA0069 family radical SAM protein [Myxococcales bacterium]